MSQDAVSDGLVVGDDGVARCWWGANTPDYQRYHDEEWAMPVSDDRRLFEKICLEGFQSGLSWLTILRKRDNFRRAFADFDIEAIARFNARSVERLLKDASIVRHRGKIESVLNNARSARALIAEHGSLAAFLWRYEPAAADRPTRLDKATLASLARTPASVKMSKDLKKNGFSYVGPTTCYALMQAMGMVNDHLSGCAARPRAEQARKRFKRPAFASAVS